MTGLLVGDHHDGGTWYVRLTFNVAVHDADPPPTSNRNISDQRDLLSLLLLSYLPYVELSNLCTFLIGRMHSFRNTQRITGHNEWNGSAIQWAQQSKIYSSLSVFSIQACHIEPSPIQSLRRTQTLHNQELVEQTSCVSLIFALPWWRSSRPRPLLLQLLLLSRFAFLLPSKHIAMLTGLDRPLKRFKKPRREVMNTTMAATSAGWTAEVTACSKYTLPPQLSLLPSEPGLVPCRRTNLDANTEIGCRRDEIGEVRRGIFL